MVRISTDLPAPEPPTKPRISPRQTSRSTASSTMRSPKPTMTPRTSMIVSRCPLTAIAHIPIEAKKMANRPSSTITRKIDSTTDAVVCRPSDSALPLHLEALHAGDDADHQRHERRLDHADLEGVER